MCFRAENGLYGLYFGQTNPLRYPVSGMGVVETVCGLWPVNGLSKNRPAFRVNAGLLPVAKSGFFRTTKLFYRKYFLKNFSFINNFVKKTPLFTTY